MGDPTERGIELAKELSGSVQILYVEQGKNPDERKGSFVHGGRRGDSFLVFLPKEAVVGSNVRVVLTAASYDKRGLPLFRGQPAQDEVIERWKANDDGTLTYGKIAVDWKMQGRTVETIETRPAQRRERAHTTNWAYQMQWGSDLNSTHIIRTRTDTYPIEIETVKDGEIIWANSGNTRLDVQNFTTAVVDVRLHEGLGISEWNSHRFDLQYSSTMKMTLLVKTGEGENYLETQWGQTPAWWQKTVEAVYPICSCGRKRLSIHANDGYGKCNLCLSEEHCVRCGRQGMVKQVNGRWVCASCEKYEEAEQLIRSLLLPEHLAAISQEAERLVKATHLSSNDAMVLFGATIGHFDQSSYSQRSACDVFLDRCKAYSHIYLFTEGFRGSKLAPAALTLLVYLPQAQGNALVDMIAWVAEGNRVLNSFYVQTQEQGYQRTPTLTRDQLTALKERIEKQEAVLSDWLRGSEEGRQVLVNAVNQVQFLNLLLEHQRILDGLAREVTDVLVDSSQNYREGLEAAAKVLSMVGSFGILSQQLEQHLSICPLCKQPLEKGECNNHHPSDQLALIHWAKQSGETQITPLVRLVTESGLVVAEIRVHTGGRGRHSYGDIYRVQFPDAHVSDPFRAKAWNGESFTELRLETPGLGSAGMWNEHTPRIREVSSAIRRVQLQIGEIEKQLSDVREERETAEEALLERLTAPTSQPIVDGTVLSVVFTLGFTQEGTEVTAGPFYDEPSATWVKLVPAKWLTEEPPDGVELLVRVEAKNGSQTHLFSYKTDQLEGQEGKTVSVCGYQVVPVADPHELEINLAELKGTLAQLEAELTSLQ